MKKTDNKIMWAIIEGMNWAGRCNEPRIYDTMKIEFMRRYREETAANVQEFVTARFNELYKAYDKFSEDGSTAGHYGGDDSFGDMLHHVIGMGEKTFKSVMKDMTELNGIDVVESFSYALPYKEDYANVSLVDDNERLEEAVHLATETFWFSIAESYPEIKTGDVSLDEVLSFEAAMKQSVKTWVKNNEPK